MDDRQLAPVRGMAPARLGEVFVSINFFPF